MCANLSQMPAARILARITGIHQFTPSPSTSAAAYRMSRAIVDKTAGASECAAADKQPLLLSETATLRTRP